MSNIRTLYLFAPKSHDRKTIRSPVNQTAIPWCTAHKHEARSATDCWLRLVSEDLEDCVISTGDPDHEWWQDA